MRARSTRLLSLAVGGVAVAAACHGVPPPVAPPPAVSAPETVLLRVHGRVGQARRVRIEVANFTRFGSGELPSGDSARPSMQMVQFATESVTAVSGDTITMVSVTDSSRMDALYMNLLPRGTLDSLSMRGLTVTTKLDGRGRVLSIVSKGSPRLDQQMATARRMFPGLDSANSGGEARGSYVSLPERPVRVGDAWSDTSSVPRGLGMQGGSVVASYRLERIETRGGHRIAVISSDLVTPPISIEQPMRLTSGPMHTIGEVQVDLDAGWIVSRTATMSGSMHSAMGDVTMRMVTRQVPVEEGP